MARYIDADALLNKRPFTISGGKPSEYLEGFLDCVDEAKEAINNTPAADVVEKDKIAEMLRLMFDDYCACNYNGNDEWLPMKCKYAETDCPAPEERLGCWKEFVEYFLAKMDGGKTE